MERTPRYRAIIAPGVPESRRQNKLGPVDKRILNRPAAQAEYFASG